MSTKLEINSIEKRLSNANAKIGVIGLGYVGIPLVTALHKNNFDVTGFDINQALVDNLNNGKSHIKHISDDTILSLNNSEKFTATTEFSNLQNMDAIIICVPTPLTKQREPDLKYVIATTKNIAENLQKGQLITLESTTYPGTTTEVMKPILEEISGLKSGKDFFLAYSPEREDPGNDGFSTHNTPKVVGGDGEDALTLAKALYNKIIGEVVPVSSPETAEAVKLTENIFRAVNIALVNELKVIYEKMGIDVWEVIDAAATKPFGFMPFYPGPGLGGHCIPIDPFYLTWKAREYGVHTRFIELAGEINHSMIRYVTDNLADALSTRTQKSISGAKILLLGVAYKRNVDDMRESPSLIIWEYLKQKSATVDYHDPYIPKIPKTRDHMALHEQQSIELTPDNLKSYDAILLVTDHTNVDYKMIADHGKLIIDSRNIFAKNGITQDNIIKT